MKSAAVGPAPILELLHARHEAHGQITEQDLRELAPVAKVSATELYGAASAYPLFQGESEPSWPRVRLREVVKEIGVPQSVFFGNDDPFEIAAAALAKPPGEIIETVSSNGLRGRGGAGFPTGRKWEAVRDAPGNTKYLICNADESEPGTFKDCLLLNEQPRRVLAGMRIAAHAVRATSGIIYLRHSYSHQFEILTEEIAGLRKDGHFGEEFDVVIRRGAGSYICGEETALLNSLEGRRPTPRERPPYPATAGLFGAPTLVQNVETLAAVPAIVDRGADWFCGAGSPKLYCVSGDLPKPALFELPMTTTARELLSRAGCDLQTLKAFTLGGVSGGLLPPSQLDIQLDFKNTRANGAALGSGAVIAVDSSHCLLRFVRDALEFFVHESCGKCFPCRIGTMRLRERLDSLCSFKKDAPDEIPEIIQVLDQASACGLGSAAGLIVSNLLETFESEVTAHIQGECPAGECSP